MIPTMREKRRYIHFKLECNRRLSETEAKDELYNAILSFLGELGFSKANPRLVEFNDNSGILMCCNPEVQRVKAALALVDKIKGENGCIRVLKVSGMIGKLQ
ncbi:ribonuclease P protein component 2 [Candidatus Micrarchaeota archaeon]|nr:ribonuclease P protein component 2 [Candidatus Micrarchaeota archaeon]